MRYQGQQSSQPFSHAARDQFLWAIEQAFGLDESRLRRLYGQRGDNPDGRLYEVDGP